MNPVLTDLLSIPRLYIDPIIFDESGDVNKIILISPLFYLYACFLREQLFNIHNQSLPLYTFGVDDSSRKGNLFCLLAQGT